MAPECTLRAVIFDWLPWEGTEKQVRRVSDSYRGGTSNFHFFFFFSFLLSHFYSFTNFDLVTLSDAQCPGHFLCFPLILLLNGAVTGHILIPPILFRWLYERPMWLLVPAEVVLSPRTTGEDATYSNSEPKVTPGSFLCYGLAFSATLVCCDPVPRARVTSAVT